jgi:hypothetical protein
MLYATSASALTCSATHDGKTYWSWRSIDGKRCWYRGHSVVPKSQLHWPAKRWLPPVAPKLKLDDPVFPPGPKVEEPNEIDLLSDIPPFPDLIEDRPFGPWEERIMGAFTK